jgi:hypothetical protein
VSYNSFNFLSTSFGSGFIVAPTEIPNEYIAVWVGYSGHHPPTDWTKLLEWSNDLLTSDAIEVMKVAKPKVHIVFFFESLTFSRVP